MQEGPFDLRGLGTVSATGGVWNIDANKPVSLVTFDTESPEKAAIVASKYIADILGYSAHQVLEEPFPWQGWTCEIRHGGTWVVGISGSQVHVLSGSDRDALASAAETIGAANWTVPALNQHPRFLDAFDNESMKFWWMPTTKTEKQIEWLSQFPAGINIHGQKLDLSPAPGVIDISGPQNAFSQLADLNKTYRFMIWAGLPAWFDVLGSPEVHIEEKADAYLGRRFFETGGYNSFQVASPSAQAVMLGTTVQMMRAADSPDIIGWMDPQGEYHLTDPLGNPPGAAERFPAFLRDVQGYTLQSLGEAWEGNPAAFADWSDIPLHEGAWYQGRRGNFVDLDLRPWRWHNGDLATGEADGWFRPDFDASDWAETPRLHPRMLAQWDISRIKPLWIRIRETLPDDWPRDSPVYLHIMPYTEHRGGELTIWVNGAEVAREFQSTPGAPINKHTFVEVTGHLRPGKNDIAIYSNGGRISHHVFLSDLPGASFPFEDPQLNRRFLDWRDYLIWEKKQTLLSFLRTMRSVDPDRPVKVMTPHLFQAEAMEIFEQYGAYPQLTGQGSWYRPMHYKGYSKLRHIPSSSEAGSEKKGPKDTQEMFGNMLWEGQDAHDYVFDFARDFWPKKEKVAWWEENVAVIRTLGKTDFIDFPLGVLRDVRQDQRYARSEIWNWDMSRGPLPALGLTPVLIDGLEFERGLADDLPVILDCATLVMTPAMVAALHRYVEGGGVFVTQFHTGQHDVNERDTWPLATSLGLHIEPKRVNEENHHRWPLGKIRFTEEQDLFPSLKGLGAEGSGVSIDSNDIAQSGAISMQSDDQNVTPIAFWEDGSMAIAEVRVGKGRFIFMGTPFQTRFRDVAGKWLNDSERQALVEELLLSLGIQRETSVSDERVWFERRESKNGLYDVYFAAAIGERNKDWTFDDEIRAELVTTRPFTTAVEMTAADLPDISAQITDGVTSLGEQVFTPYQVRQFAVVRPDAGLAGPMHWLETQRRHWRAIERVGPEIADGVVADAEAVAKEFGEAGLDISSDWKALINPAETDDTAWTTATPDAAWVPATMGSWSGQGWDDATHVRYRKTVELPEDWRNDAGRLIFGSMGYFSLGLKDAARIWINGQPMNGRFDGHFNFDVTELAKNGQLDIAMEITSEGLDRGPLATLYLRRTLAPEAALDLAGEWERIRDWSGKPEGSITLPIAASGDERIFGFRRTFEVPAEWAGRRVQLVIDHGTNSNNARADAMIFNGLHYARNADWTPMGVRVDGWLKPGELNELELYGHFHMQATYEGFVPNIRAIRLELLPEVTR